MGLLASIFAYLSAVAAIIVFFLMSADALLNHAHRQTTNPRPELVTVLKINSHKPNKAAHAPQQTADAIPKTSAAAEYRRTADLSNTRSQERHRRVLRRGQQARDWAFRRDHAAAPLAIGYAREAVPRFSDAPRR
jgi:hypothetical protein